MGECRCSREHSMDAIRLSMGTGKAYPSRHLKSSEVSFQINSLWWCFRAGLGF